MKAVFFSISIFTSLLLIQCKCKSVAFQEKPAFNYADIYAQDWVGGQPGNSGINVVVHIEDATAIVPDSMYYRGRIAPIEVSTNDSGTRWIGRFKKTVRNDVNLNDNPNAPIEKEIEKAKDLPFKLKEDEVVLKYHDGENTYYYKWKKVPQKEMLFYQSARPKPQL